MKFRPAPLATLLIGIASIFFSCQVKEQIEEFEETKIILKESLFRFTVIHPDQLISSESSTDLSWDWQTRNLLIQAFVLNSFNPIIVKRDIFAPWYTQSNALNIIDPKNSSEDGYKLVMRNFGSPENGVWRPYFGLLNTKTNLLRIFIHNSQSQPGHYVEAKLILIDNQNNQSKSYDSKPARITQFESWFNLEFQLEPNQLRAPFEEVKFLIECEGIRETVID